MKTRILTIILLALSFAAKASEEIMIIVDTEQQFAEEQTTLVENHRYAEILAAERPIKTANFSKVSFDIGMGGKSLKARGTMKIISDNFMQISVQFLGMEVARVEVTPDSVWVFNRFNRTYTAIHHSAVFPNIFYNFQALFLNRLFVFGAQKMPNPPFGKIEEDEDFTTDIFLSFMDYDNVAYHNFRINADNRISVLHLNTNETNVQCEYSAFKQTGEIAYPSAMSLKIDMGNVAYLVDIDINAVEFNQPVSISKSNISNFKLLSLEEFIAKIMKML